jgi:hypothetical protein
MSDPNRLSKVNIRQLAEDIAASTTSYGRRLDPEAFAARLWKQTRRCILCRKPSYVFAVYVPDEKADPVIRTGLAPHQARTFFYGLCVKCYQSENAAERVEEEIADGHLKEANVRAELDAAGVSYTNESMPDGRRWIAIGRDNVA